MENATEALVMAASVLLLILALTVSISSFTTIKVQVEDILGTRDQIQPVQESSNEYINYLKSSEEGATRIVKTEAIIAALKRMKKEDYTIYIETDLTNVSTSDTIFGFKLKDNNNVIELSNAHSATIFTYRKDNKLINGLNPKVVSEIYRITEGKEYLEYIGIYQEKTDEGVSEANKLTKKIITFKKI